VCVCVCSACVRGVRCKVVNLVRIAVAAVYVCMYVFEYVCTHAYEYVYTCLNLFAHVYMHMYVYVCIHLYICGHEMPWISGWRRCIECLIFTGDFSQENSIIIRSFAERDLQLKASHTYHHPVWGGYD